MTFLKVVAIFVAGCFGILLVAAVSGVIWTIHDIVNGDDNWRDFQDGWWSFRYVILFGPYSMFLAAVPIFLITERKLNFTTHHAVYIGAFVAGMTPFLISAIGFDTVNGGVLLLALLYALAGAIAAPPTWGLYNLILGTSRRRPNLTSPG